MSGNRPATLGNFEFFNNYSEQTLVFLDESELSSMDGSAQAWG